MPNQRAGVRGSATLTIWGDPIIGKALVLLLRGSGYKAKFLPALPSSKPPSLKDTQLLVLTPTPQLSAEERNSLLAALLGDTPAATNLLVLELVTPSEKNTRRTHAKRIMAQLVLAL